MTVAELYEQTIKGLPLSDRLAIAALILNNIVRVPTDVSDAWSDEDLADFSAASLAGLGGDKEGTPSA
jgi:hypothetical protein